MRKLFLAIAILFSVTVFGQKVDTAFAKFANDIMSKTTIKDFKEWIWDNNVGTKDYDAFIRMQNYFIQQKYVASKAKK